MEEEEEKKYPATCEYCLRRFSTVDPIIECAECRPTHLFFCKTCFALGAEGGRHSRSHNYRVHIRRPQEIVEADTELGTWGFEDDAKLVTSTRLTKAANWPHLAEALKFTGNHEALQMHFDKYFVRGEIGTFSRDFIELWRALQHGDYPWWDHLYRMSEDIKFQIVVMCWLYSDKEPPVLDGDAMLKELTSFINERRLSYETAKLEGKQKKCSQQKPEVIELDDEPCCSKQASTIAAPPVKTPEKKKLNEPLTINTSLDANNSDKDLTSARRSMRPRSNTKEKESATDSARRASLRDRSARKSMAEFSVSPPQTPTIPRRRSSPKKIAEDVVQEVSPRRRRVSGASSAGLPSPQVNTDDVHFVKPQLRDKRDDGIPERTRNKSSSFAKETPAPLDRFSVTCRCPQHFSSSTSFCLQCGWSPTESVAPYNREWYIIETNTGYVVVNCDLRHEKDIRCTIDKEETGRAEEILSATFATFPRLPPRDRSASLMSSTVRDEPAAPSTTGKRRGRPPRKDKQKYADQPSAALATEPKEFMRVEEAAPEDDTVKMRVKPLKLVRRADHAASSGKFEIVLQNSDTEEVLHENEVHQVPKLRLRHGASVRLDRAVGEEVEIEEDQDAIEGRSESLRERHPSDRLSARGSLDFQPRLSLPRSSATPARSASKESRPRASPIKDQKMRASTSKDRKSSSKDVDQRSRNASGEQSCLLPCPQRRSRVASDADSDGGSSGRFADYQINFALLNGIPPNHDPELFEQRQNPELESQYCNDEPMIVECEATVTRKSSKRTQQPPAAPPPAPPPVQNEFEEPEPMEVCEQPNDENSFALENSSSPTGFDEEGSTLFIPSFGMDLRSNSKTKAVPKVPQPQQRQCIGSGFSNSNTARTHKHSESSEDDDPSDYESILNDLKAHSLNVELNGDTLKLTDPVPQKVVRKTLREKAGGRCSEVESDCSDDSLWEHLANILKPSEELNDPNVSIEFDARRRRDSAGSKKGLSIERHELNGDYWKPSSTKREERFGRRSRRTNSPRASIRETSPRHNCDEDFYSCEYFEDADALYDNEDSDVGSTLSSEDIDDRNFDCRESSSEDSSDEDEMTKIIEGLPDPNLVDDQLPLQKRGKQAHTTSRNLRALKHATGWRPQWGGKLIGEELKSIEGMSEQDAESTKEVLEAIDVLSEPLDAKTGKPQESLEPLGDLTKAIPFPGRHILTSLNNDPKRASLMLAGIPLVFKQPLSISEPEDDEKKKCSDDFMVDDVTQVHSESVEKMDVGHDVVEQEEEVVPKRPCGRFSAVFEIHQRRPKLRPKKPEVVTLSSDGEGNEKDDADSDEIQIIGYRKAPVVKIAIPAPATVPVPAPFVWEVEKSLISVRKSNRGGHLSTIFASLSLKDEPLRKKFNNLNRQSVVACEPAKRRTKAFLDKHRENVVFQLRGGIQLKAHVYMPLRPVAPKFRPILFPPTLLPIPTKTTREKATPNGVSSSHSTKTPRTSSKTPSTSKLRPRPEPLYKKCLRNATAKAPQEVERSSSSDDEEDVPNVKKTPQSKSDDVFQVASSSSDNSDTERAPPNKILRRNSGRRQPTRAAHESDDSDDSAEELPQCSVKRQGLDEYQKKRIASRILEMSTYKYVPITMKKPTNFKTKPAKKVQSKTQKKITFAKKPAEDDHPHDEDIQMISDDTDGEQPEPSTSAAQPNDVLLVIDSEASSSDSESIVDVTPAAGGKRATKDGATPARKGGRRRRKKKKAQTKKDRRLQQIARKRQNMEKKSEQERQRIYEVVGNNRDISAMAHGGLSRFARLSFEEPGKDACKGRADEMEMLAYYPGRVDYELEMNNDMEELMSHTLFKDYPGDKHDEVLDMENEIKIVRSQRYNRVMADRLAANRAIYLHNKNKEYLEFLKKVNLGRQKPSEIVADRSKEEALVARLQQCFRPEEIENITKKRERIAALSERVKALQALQREGVTEFTKEVRDQVDKAMEISKPKERKRKYKKTKFSSNNKYKQNSKWNRMKKMYSTA